ncbi:MAG: CHASE domain-containing protein [Mycobacterium sp.]|nr:CHASE domain-containing protein [Mycobacterium sp.]
MNRSVRTEQPNRRPRKPATWDRPGNLWTPDRRPTWSSAFVISPAVAVLYAALGLPALALSQMAGLASPVWPAAGVAFAAALIWRWRALPGVFFGSAGVNAFWLTRLGEPASQTWFLAAAVGIGSVLGAFAGAALVGRFVGPIRRLDTPRAVLLTLAFGGLLGSTIAPTIGIATQLAAGLIDPSPAAMGWLTWWVGDAIGVITIAPVMLMFLPSQARYWAGRRWNIAAPSLVIVGILMTAVVQNVASERARIDNAVQKLGTRAAANLVGTIALHQEVLEGLRGLLDASEYVTAKEFETYTNDVLTRLPSLQALSWDPVVPQAELAAFEARQRAQPGLQAFTVTERDAAGNLRPVSPRPEYVVVAYIEPIATNRGALGFDIDSTPLRAAAIATARDTGQTTATPPIDLVQDSDTQKGMLALLPVYEGGADPGSTSARRAALRGFTASVYRLGDLLAETFGGTEWDRVEVTLIDVSSRADPVVIADLPARVSAPRDQASAAPAATTLPLDVYGRTWELTVRPTSTAFVDSHGSVTVILLLVALALTFMLEAFLLVLSGMNALARRLMSELSSADRYIASILPSDLEAPVPVASRYVPSRELGGDSFDHRWIDDDHLIVYLVDVSGHGVASALLSVTVHNLLRSGTLDIDTLRDPGEVLTELNRLFQMEEHAGNYFTIWYGVYQPSTHTLSYSGAGHPPTIVLTADGSDPARLPSESIPIGVMEDSTFETRHCTVNPDTALLIYSDGAFDLTLRDGRTWTLDDFISLCARTATKPGWTLDDLIDQIRNRSTSGLFDDDCTLVRVSIR